MRDALRRHVTPGATPQTEQARPDQKRNNAGGYTFTVSDKQRLNRFLTIGTDGGTYYVTERKLTRDNAALVIKMAEASNRDLLSETTSISEGGRAPRNTPALFAHAAAAGLGSTEYRAEALDLLPRVARTGYHLLVWAEFIEMFRGWGPQLVKGVRNWYLAKTPEDLAYQLLKYKQREGWSQRDLIRLCGLKGAGPRVTDPHEAIFAHVLKRDVATEALPFLFEIAARVHETRNVKTWDRLIRENRSLSREMLPSEALREKAVWLAMLEGGNLPLGALLRNLSTLTRLGITGPLAAGNKVVRSRLTDAEAIKRARIHPVAVLIALKTYALGHSLDGKSEWRPEATVIDALNEMFYLAFGAIEPAGRRTVIATDVSASMGWPIVDHRTRKLVYPFTAAEIVGALAMVAMRTETEYAMIGVSGQVVHLPVSAQMRLDDVLRTMKAHTAGSTDLSLPMWWAEYNDLAVDTFQVYTDNETWYGPIHPHEALRRYRKHSGINARLQVIGVTPTEFSIADPLDPGQLDVSGFDSAVPKLLADHARGDL